MLLTAMLRSIDVLILVLMEYALGAFSERAKSLMSKVLILVLMEYALGGLIQALELGTDES